MRVTANVLITALIYAATLFAAYFLINGPAAALSSDIAKWLWSPAALVIGSLSVLSWKVHETKRVEGLKKGQREKLRLIAGKVQKRLYLISLIAFAGAIGGLFPSYLRAPFDVYLVSLAFSATFGSCAIALAIYPLTQRDIQKFEDRAREALSAESDSRKFRERLAGLASAEAQSAMGPDSPENRVEGPTRPD